MLNKSHARFPAIALTDDAIPTCCAFCLFSHSPFSCDRSLAHNWYVALCFCCGPCNVFPYPCCHYVFYPYSFCLCCPVSLYAYPCCGYDCGCVFYVYLYPYWSLCNVPCFCCGFCCEAYCSTFTAVAAVLDKQLCRLTGATKHFVLVKSSTSYATIGAEEPCSVLRDNSGELANHQHHYCQSGVAVTWLDRLHLLSTLRNVCDD